MSERATERLVRDIARAHLDRILINLADAVVGDFPPVTISRAEDPFQVSLVVRHSAAPSVLPITSAEQNHRAPPPPPKLAPQPSGVAKLRRIHKKILEKASTTEAIPAKKLITLAGYKDNSYSFEAITYLARARLLVRTPDGYLRAS